MPIEELREHQLRRLRQQVKDCYHKTNFYRKKFDDAGLSPEDIKTLNDLEKIPFTTKNDLRDNYPFGMVAVSLDDIVEKLIPCYGENAPVAVVYKASWRDEKTVKGTLTDISGKVKKEKIQKTAIIIVGAGLERGHAASKLYGAAFSHGYRKA